MQKTKISCIGSREVGQDKVLLMEHIGEYIAQRGFFIGTGNAKGSDQAFSRGANRVDPGQVVLYLPWSSYESQAIDALNKIMVPTQIQEERWKQVAARNHPAWDHLSAGARKMMVRNAGIIIGSKAVVACMSHKKNGGGGTGHGWRIAEELGIPKIDISGDISLSQVTDFLDMNVPIVYSAREMAAKINADLPAISKQSDLIIDTMTGRRYDLKD
jgi:hypothetical protein